MSTTTELLESRIDVVTANGVRWGSRSTLVAAVLHFLKLKTELEVLGSGHSADLIEDEAVALWVWVHVTLDLLASHVPSPVACKPPDGMRG
jgi:hypothetical protein